MSQTAQTAGVIDRATKNLTNAIASALKVTNDLAPLTEQVNELTSNIEQKEAQLAALNTDFDHQLRTRTAELNVRVKEAEDIVLGELMTRRGLAKIANSELDALNRALAEAKADNSEAISAAVKTAESALHAGYKAQLRDMQSKHEVESAQTNAKVSSLMERNEFLSQQIDALRVQIDAERTTRLEIARADAGRQGVVVNAGKQ